MDAIDFDNVKAEKAKAMRRYNRLRTIAKLFRLIEICLALVLLSYISARLPFAVKISGEYFRRLISIIVSPFFIFLISNAIVITLLAKSRQSPTINNAETDLYRKFINYGSENCPPVPEPEKIVCHDKPIVSEVNTLSPKSNEVAVVAVPVPDVKTFKRSVSEKMKRENLENNCGKLRRSGTEKCRKVVDSGEVLAETVYLFDKLSNEEFQRTIEEFIAKQVKFHHEEKFDMVTCC